MEKITKEEFKVKGAEAASKVKELVKKGGVHRIIIKNPSDKEVARFTLPHGIVGAALAPILQAVGAIAGVLSSCTIVIEKEDTN